MTRLFSMLLLSVFTLGFAPPPRTVWDRDIVWLHDGLDELGNLESIAGFEILITAPSEDMNADGVPLQGIFLAEQSARDISVLGGYVAPLAGFETAALPRGEYLVWVAAVDVSGNVSEWVSTAIESVRPQKVRNLRRQ